MILHRLTLRAIGPYAGEHSIDFAALGASGVFLLEGPTGSGKSTIIDALVFALYGGLAGSTSSTDRLRSHHAAPTVEPFVEVVFETAAGIHRVRRTPAYRRPKTRGTGTTPQNQTVTLVLLTSPDAVEGTVISTSAQETGAEIGRILGLTRQQFVQTVVLPQGEFAAFLRSTGEKRKEVLQSLFGTEIYERTTAQLVDRRVAARASIAAAEHEVELALGRLREATGADDEVFAEALAAEGAGGRGGSEGPSRPGGPTGPGGLAGLVSALADEADDLEGRRSAAVAARDTARARLDEQRRRVRALERRAGLLRREAAVREAETGVRASQALVERARRASSVSIALEGLRRADERLAATGEQVRAARGADDLDPDLVESDDRESAAGRRDALTAELGSSTETARLEATLAGRRAALAEADEAVSAETERLARLESALAERPAARHDLEIALTTLTEAVVAVGPAEADVLAAVDRGVRLDELERLDAEAEHATSEVHTAARAALAAAAIEDALRRRKIAGMAGELAAGLVDGDPCPVCGAEHHPAPAVITADHPDDDAIDRAADERSRLETVLADAAARRSVAIDRRDERAAALEGVTRARVETELRDARARVDAARRAIDARDAAALALEQHDTATEARRAELTQARVDAATGRERAEADRRRLDDDAAAVERHLAGRAASVAELVDALRRRHGAAVRLVDALDAHRPASAEVERRRVDLDDSLAAAGFADVEAVAAATLPGAEVDRLAAVVAAHEREVAVVAAGLAEPEIVALGAASLEPVGATDGGGAVAEVDSDAEIDAARAGETSATADLAASEATAAEVADRSARARERATRSATALDALTRASAVGDEAAERARAVVRMADLASASSAVNVKGVTLGTYVLLRRFDDVVAAANVRLSVMSSGRYQLESSDEREATSRSRKTGLSLAIRDHATDTTRDPGSFSGGETFYASLSLALGLADVVQAEAGGLELGTLFVDEGFGSLDPTTLDAVMTELGRLSASGRVVGIVSHVDELKQRIADRIEVRRLPDGSSTLRSTAAG
ncbi:hypothetical protein ASF17_03080 [Frigoribacterium sp. Leaf263]|uniref:AAA family ATPase n=1 Tax=Frigoribacterium sp. Leaf263 TaxID=1736313 RepID=UPI0006F4DC7D|nr:SMC family ATPase [Frigoribacterium sp. Leaf263]KQO84490.1 hypothetical protein ASF17_03080 [Frigoribacterium sp. Leaf263]